MALTAPHNLPVELIEAVVEAVDAHEDILSFALACSYLNGIVQKNGYLDFRELIASVGHVQLWDHLAENPHLASKVRVLTIYDSWHQIRLHRTSYRFPSTISKNIVQDDRQTFVACLPLLTGLQAVTIHPPVRVYTAASSLLSNIFSHWPSSIRSLSLRLLNSQPLDMDTHLWDTRNLRELDLTLSSTEHERVTLDAELYWPSFCALLSLNPRLEVLRIPPFVGDAPRSAKLPHLPQLRVLHIAEQGESTARQLVYYATAHPLITEFSWDTTLSVAVTNAPNLPRLERLVDTSPSFVNAMLSGRATGSVRLSNLGRFALRADTLSLLYAVSASSLRALTLSSMDSHRTLADLAAIHPDLSELHLPEELDRDNGWLSRLKRSWRITLDEVLRLFPQLCIVSGVNLHDLPKSVAKLKRDYPRLRRVNGTRVDGF